MRGAGGSEGGVIQFFVGLAMIIGGGYLFLSSIHVTTGGFGFGYSLYRVGGFSLTSGMVLIPFLFGVAMIFYNAKNILGWVLAGGSLVMLAFGVISSIQFRMRHMSAFELIMILILLMGGIGLFLNSLRKLEKGGSDG